MNTFLGGRWLSPRLATALGFAAAALLPNLPGAASAADWPQAHSDLPADPRIVFGQLPNGMRYAIMHNETPKGAVSLWLKIAAGSLEESDAQQGLAHFLEHMAFRGSKHVPQDEVWPGLQRLGLGMGADANATTRFGSTDFQFNLPHNDAQSIDTGLLRLRDIAGDLTLAQSAMDAERGVVLSEERLRDTPSYRMTKRLITLLFPNDRLPSRFPIGLVDVIQKAPVSLIRDYYNAYYRPERATLIVVGEIDPKVIEAKIVKLFSDWKPAGTAGAEPARAPLGPRRREIALFSEPGAPSMLRLAWVVKSEPDSQARERDDDIKFAALQILVNRLREATDGARKIFADVSVTPDSEFPGSLVWFVSAAIRPQDWRIAIQTATLDLRRLDAYGVNAGELQRVKSELLALFENVAADAVTRSNRDNAALIETEDNANDVVQSPTGELALAKEASSSLTVDRMNAVIRGLIRDRGPLMLLSTPAAIDGGQAAVSEALAAAEKASPLTRGTEQAKVTWPYTDFGPAGQVAERNAMPDLETTFLRFANGVRLTVKPTTFKADEVLVNVKIGNGLLDLPADRDTPRWAVDGLFFGGFKALSFEDARRALVDKPARVGAGFAENGLMLRAATRPVFLAALLQRLTAQVTAPGWRADWIEGPRTDELNRIRSSEVSPTGLFSRSRTCLLHSGDRRWCAPSAGEVAETKPDALKDLLTPILSSAPIEVTIVGNVTVDDAIAAAAKTFGALPARAAKDTAPIKPLKLRFPSGTANPVELYHHGRADQGLAAVAWPTTDMFDLKKSVDLQTLESVIQTRVTDQLRIQNAVTYSPFVDLTGSAIAPGYGYLTVATELPPAKMPLFYSTIGNIVADLRAHPIAADELERARKPEFEEVVALRQNNQYWLTALAGAQEDGRRLDLIRDTLPFLTKVNAADIQEAAKTFLSDDKAWKLEIKPATLH